MEASIAFKEPTSQRRNHSGGSRRETDLLAHFPDRDPAVAAFMFSHSEGRGSSETRLPAFPPDVHSLVLTDPLLLQGGTGLGMPTWEGANGLALLLAFIGRAWAGDPGHRPFSSQGATLGSKRNGPRGSQVCCTSPTPRLLPLRDASGDFDFIYKQDENPSSINLEEQKRL